MLAVLFEKAREAAPRSYVPYSGRESAAVLLLSDGAWVMGVRVENASFPLTISALQAAWVTAVAAGRHDIVAAIQNTPIDNSEAEWLGAELNTPPLRLGRTTIQFGELPNALGDPLSVILDSPVPESESEGVALARKVAERAYVPYSDFPVGCVLVYELPDGKTILVPGVNVEHPDWTRGLCAERTALAIMHGLGDGTIKTAYLSCPKDETGTPCGACRQVLVEFMPDTLLNMDRGDGAVEQIAPAQLLPFYFSGKTLIH